MIYFEEETQCYPAFLRKLWTDKKLQNIWYKKYPQLFDEQDYTQALNQPAPHFCEWLVAIHYYCTKGFYSLVEKYTSANHPRKLDIAKKYINLDTFNPSWKTPSLFLYNPNDTTDFQFVEVAVVKAGYSKDITPNIDGFKELAMLTNKPITLFTVTEDANY